MFSVRNVGFESQSEPARRAPRSCEPNADAACLPRRAEEGPRPSEFVGTKAEFKAALEKVRRDGYGVVDEELEEGLRSIAVPVFDQREQIVAAMNVSGHAGRVSAGTMRDRYVPALLAGAEDARSGLV